MKRIALLALTLTLLALHFAAGGTPVTAGGIELRSQNAQNRFPQGVQFQATLASDADITLVRLRYRILPYGSTGSTRPECSIGMLVNCNAVVGSGNDNLVPGAEIVYFWEVEDADGQKLETPQSKFTYQDSRFQWQSITDNAGLIVYFYAGDENANSSVLRTARETIDRFNTLEGARLDFPVKIWVYATARDLADAASGRPATNGHTLGQVSAPDTAIVSRDTDFLNVVRHEVAHIVTGNATRSAPGFPYWMNEGLSTTSQSRLLPGEEQALMVAIRGNRTLPITSLSTALKSADFPLAYAQSGAIVDHLVKTYSPEKFAELIKAFATDTTDGAFKKVYGFDQLGLENSWRKSVGLPEVTVSASSGPANVAIPTIVPFGAESSAPAPAATTAPSTGQTSSTSTNTASDGGATSTPLIAGGAIALLLILGGGAFLVLKGRAKTS